MFQVYNKFTKSESINLLIYGSLGIRPNPELEKDESLIFINIKQTCSKKLWEFWYNGKSKWWHIQQKICIISMSIKAGEREPKYKQNKDELF